MAIDWNFIRQLEGRRNSAYVPMKDGQVIQNSGVTIGTGVDLGQQTEARLRRLGVSDEIINKLSPFLGSGKRKQAAVTALEESGGLTLSDEEVDALDQALKSETLREVRNWYNKNNTQGNDWSDLSDRQQTVAASIAFNHGLDGAPTFFGHISEGNWEGVVDELEHFYSDSRNELFPRRRKELQYLVGAEPDGIIGEQTRAAIQGFLQNPMQTRELQPVPPEQPQITAEGLVSDLIQTLRDFRDTPVQPAEAAVSDVSFTPEEESFIEQAVQQLTADPRVTEGEAMLERQFQETQLAETALQAEETGTAPTKEPITFTAEEEVFINQAVNQLRGNQNVSQEDPNRDFIREIF